MHFMKCQIEKCQIEIIDQLWMRLRRPFRYPQSGHECSWERYDADRAGCVHCGGLHRCANGMAGCRCPVIATDDGAHVCLITGLCIPEVRTSCNEYVEHNTFEREPEKEGGDDEISDRIQSIIHSFLLSPSTTECKRAEQRKYVQKARQAFWRVLKQHKKENPYSLPDMCLVVAEVAKTEPPPQSLIMPISRGEVIDPRGVMQQSAESISKCIIQIQHMGFKKICQGSKFHSIVIGMLYMTRMGLKADLGMGRVFELESIPQIRELLPSETYLNSLGISNKVICDTENEIKTCIRTFTDMRARAVSNVCVRVTSAKYMKGGAKKRRVV